MQNMAETRPRTRWQRPPPTDTPIDISSTQVREWLDEPQFSTVESVPDQQAVFNFRVQFSGQPVHVIKNHQRGPLVLTGQVVLDEEIKSSLDDLSAFNRMELKARTRELLTEGPSLYYFLDEDGNNVAFEEMDRVLIERFIYPDGATQHRLMNDIFKVGKRLIQLNESISLLIERFGVESEQFDVENDQ